jgi:hypothetical protein
VDEFQEVRTLNAGALQRLVLVLNRDDQMRQLVLRADTHRTDASFEYPLRGVSPRVNFSRLKSDSRGKVQAQRL